MNLPISNLHLTDDLVNAADHILGQIAAGAGKIEIVDRETYPATSLMILLPRTAEARARVKAEQELLWPRLTALLEDDRVETTLRQLFA